MKLGKKITFEDITEEIGKQEVYKNTLIQIANFIEDTRKCIYTNVDNTDENKQILDDKLFKIQSDLRYECVEIIEYLKFKEEGK